MRYPWALYDHSVYWTLPDDGALIRCVECQELKKHTDVVFTQVPMGKRSVLCRSCVDEEWLEQAENRGVFPL